MTNPTNNLATAASAESASNAPPTFAIWGLVLVAIVLAALALTLVWFMGEMLNVPNVDAKKTASICILSVLAAVVLLHLGAMNVGAYSMAGRIFRRDTGPEAANVSRPLNRDPRLQSLCDDLRTTHGIYWRYRLPWLMLNGSDDLLTEVAPGLKQVGVVHVGDTILVHAAPDGIDAALWRKQLRQLRSRLPVDCVVQVVRASRDIQPDAELARSLASIATDLGWAAPVTFLHAVETTGKQPDTFQAIGTFMPSSSRRPQQDASNALNTELVILELHTGTAGVQLCDASTRMPYLAQMSQYIGKHRERIVTVGAALIASKWRRTPLAGVMFAPVFPGAAVVAAPVALLGTAALDGHAASRGNAAEVAAAAAIVVGTLSEPPPSLRPTWQQIGRSAQQRHGKRVGFYWPNAVTALVMALVIGWFVALTISFVGNRHLIRNAQVSANGALAATPGSAIALRAQLALQLQIEAVEYRQQHGAPWYLRAGLNHDRDILAALWRPYAQTGRKILVTPVQQNLEAALVDLSQMPTQRLDEQTSRLALDGHKALKTYLMLADPGRADAAFMTPLLMRYWSTNASLPTGEKLDISERLLGFYAQHLKPHEDWRIQPRQELVNASRQTLLAVIGVKNSEDTIYRGVLDTIGNRYPDQSLALLTAGTDTRGLLRASSSVPGVFTRQAYDGTIAAAIDEAAKRNEVANDWVLVGVQQRQDAAQSDSSTQPAQPASSSQSSQLAQSADTMKAALTSRYFADYADHWQSFMNTLQWEPSPTLPSAIEQLKLMADARQSPVIALMKSLEYQGGAGALKESLSDTLVTKTQHLFAGKVEVAESAKPDPAGPLGAPFDPVLRLVAQDDTNATTAVSSDLSLQRFMERVTTLRLKLQQISDSPDSDAQARQVAQSLFQGKGSALADTQAYAQLIAASLGAQWAGMGDALFVRPVVQATQTVLQPAQVSLNDAWRQTIVATWNRSFAGRYPFASTDNDASLPELARFLRPQGGLIGAFLGAQLAGVLELQGDQWVPVSTGTTTLSFDPEFLKALNTLQRIAGHLLAQGEPQYRFDFRPVPVAGVTDTVFTLDGQSLHYYNQQESWQALTWPSNNPQGLGTRLQWQTEKAGTNRSFEFSGRWGLVRMLERARVQPVDSATFQLTWQAAPDAHALKTAQATTSKPPAVASASTIATTSDEDQDEDDEYGRTNDHTNTHTNDASSALKRLDTLTTQGPLTPASQDITYPLSFMMRTDVGKGPLELLALRNFTLPTRIFAGKASAIAAGAKKTAQTDGPPPLPRAMFDAAKHAETPLPGGQKPL